MAFGSCTNPLLSQLSMLAELRTVLDGCHCFRAFLMETLPLLFRTNTHLDRELCQKQAFESGCADGSGQGSRKCSHVYDSNTWRWNFGRPQPRIGGLSVTKTERIRSQSRSDSSQRADETRKARKRAHIPVVYTFCQ